MNAELLKTVKKTYPGIEQSFEKLQYCIEKHSSSLQKITIQFNNACPIYCIFDGYYMLWYGDHGAFSFNCTWRTSLDSVPFDSPEYLFGKLDSANKYKEFRRELVKPICLDFLHDSSWYTDELTDEQRADVDDMLSCSTNYAWEYASLDDHVDGEMLDRIQKVIHSQNEYDYISNLNMLEETDPLFDCDCCLHFAPYEITGHFYYILTCLNYIYDNEQEASKLSNMTLKDLHELCVKHQQNNKDCETCSVYKFCNRSLCDVYPSGWRLD